MYTIVVGGGKIKKGLVELIVLNYLKSNDSYGYEIKQHVETVFSINESSIYSALIRATTNKHVEAYFQESDSGPVRKYFKLTILGKQYLESMIKEWKEYSSNINKVINNGK